MDNSTIRAYAFINDTNWLSSEEIIYSGTTNLKRITQECKYVKQSFKKASFNLLGKKIGDIRKELLQIRIFKDDSVKKSIELVK